MQDSHPKLLPLLASWPSASMLLSSSPTPPSSAQGYSPSLPLLFYSYSSPFVLFLLIWYNKVYDCMEMVEEEGKVHTIVFDFASVSYIDSTGVKYLKVSLLLSFPPSPLLFIFLKQEVLRELNIKGVLSLYADVRPSVLTILKKSGLFREVGEDHFFLRVSSSPPFSSPPLPSLSSLFSSPSSFSDLLCIGSRCNEDSNHGTIKHRSDTGGASGVQVELPPYQGCCGLQPDFVDRHMYTYI